MLCDLTTCDVHVLNWVQAEMIDMQGKKGRSGWHLLRRDMVGMLKIKGDVLIRTFIRIRGRPYIFESRYR